jgi:septal ring factor EnvC (AmiA/AmiB activator)
MLKSQRADLILRTSGKISQTAGTHSGISKPVEKITEKREVLEKSIKDHEKELAEIDQYIDTCEEYYAIMLDLHYRKGKTWLSIALRTGGNNTAESVRKACHRYVERTQKFV